MSVLVASRVSPELWEFPKWVVRSIENVNESVVRFFEDRQTQLEKVDDLGLIGSEIEGKTENVHYYLCIPSSTAGLSYIEGYIAVQWFSVYEAEESIPSIGDRVALERAVDSFLVFKAGGLS